MLRVGSFLAKPLGIRRYRSDMNGKLIRIGQITYDFEDGKVAMKTLATIFDSGVRKISYVNTQPIKLDVEGNPTTEHNKWGIVPVEDFVKQGGQLIRTEDGHLGLEIAWSCPLSASEISDGIFYSMDEAS